MYVGTTGFLGTRRVPPVLVPLLIGPATAELAALGKAALIPGDS